MDASSGSAFGSAALEAPTDHHDILLFYCHNSGQTWFYNV